MKTVFGKYIYGAYSNSKSYKIKIVGRALLVQLKNICLCDVSAKTIKTKFAK